MDNMAQATASQLVEAKDREINVLKIKLNAAEDFVDQLRSQLRETEDGLQESRRTYHTVEIEKESVRSELETVRNKVSRLTQENAELTNLMERRNQDMKILETEIDSLKKRLESVTEANLDSSIRLESFELREISLRHREVRLEQDVKLKDNKIQILEKELDQLVKEVTKVRKERTANVCDLEASLEQKSAEVCRLREEVVHLKKGLDVKDQHASLLSSKMKEQQEKWETLESNFQDEIRALNDLLDVQKKIISDDKKKHDILINTVQDMEKLLKTAEEAHSQMEQTLSQNASEFIEKLSARDSIIAEIEKELENCKLQLSLASKSNLERELEAFFPSASSASRLLRERSSLGSSADVCRLQEEVEVLKSENDRLKNELGKVVAEAEEKTPIIHGKIMEHKNSLALLSEMQNHLTTLNSEKEKWDEERETLVQMNNHSQREVKRFQQANEDLSRQVQRLLMNVQELSGRSLAEQIHNITPSPSRSSTNNVITQHLVTFRDVEELQLQNQRLLASLREIGEKNDEDELEKSRRGSSNEAVEELKKAMAEIETLRIERKRQSEKMDALIKQRDALQVLASSLAPSENLVDLNKSSASDTASEEKVNYFKQRIEKTDEELSRCQARAEQRQKELTDQLIQAKEEVTSAKILKASAESKLQQVQENLEEARKLITSIRAAHDDAISQNEKLTKTNKKISTDLRQIKDDFDSLKDDLRTTKAKLKTAIEERDALHVRESQITTELESLRRELRGMSSLGETTKTLNSYIDKMKSDDRRLSMAEALVDQLQRENGDLKNRLQSIQEELQGKANAELSEVKELKDKIQQLTDANNRLTKTATLIKSRNETLLKSLEAAKAEVKPDLSKRVSELEAVIKLKSDEVAAARLEIDNKNVEIAKLTQDLTQTKASASENDGRLKNVMNQLNFKMKQLMEKSSKMEADSKNELEKARQVSITLLREKDGLQRQLQQTESSAPSDVDKELAKTVETLKTENENLKKDVENKDDRMKKLAHQAKSRIQQLTNNIKDVQKQLDEREKRISSLEQAQDEVLRLQTLQTQHEAKIAKLEKELEDARSEKKDPSAGDATMTTQTTTANIPVASAAPITTVALGPVRHPVLPTPQQPQPSTSKPPPTASIRPLPQSRTSVPVVTVATVLPTQSPAVGVVAPTSSSMEPMEPSSPVQENPANISQPAIMGPVTQSTEVAPIQPQPSTSQALPIAVIQEVAPHQVPEEDADRGVKRHQDDSPEQSVSTTKKSKTEEHVKSGSGEGPAADERGERRENDIITIDSEGSYNDMEEDEQQEHDGSGSGEDRESRGDSQSDYDSEQEDQEDDTNSQHDYHSDAGNSPDEREEEQQGEPIIVIGESNESQADNSNDPRSENIQGGQIDAEGEGEVLSTDAPVQFGLQTQRAQPASFAVPAHLNIERQRNNFFLNQTGQGYDEAGESIVPGTPTLFVPRRGDGTEALNSPRVPQNTFLFASAPPAESSLGLHLESELVPDEAQADLVPEIPEEQSAEVGDIADAPDDHQQETDPREEEDSGSQELEAQPSTSSAFEGSTSASDRPAGSRPGPLSRTRARAPIVWASQQDQTANQPTGTSPAPEDAPAAGELSESSVTRGRRGRLRLLTRQNYAPRRGSGWRGGRGGRGQ